MSTNQTITFLIALAFGLLTVPAIAFVVMSLVFDRRQQRALRGGNLGLAPDRPLVSVVVPSYNEERVIDGCVASILDCGYPELEVILVDDGSTDRTPALIRDWAAKHPQVVRAVSQANAGKGAALNAGTAFTRGPIVMYVDADGVFTPDTIPAMLRAFDNPQVGAVCGNDRPANPDRLLTRFLATISHVGTGMARRALHLLNCVPVVSGNIGAFRREALDATQIPGIGPLRPDTVGEDLELTWRMRLAGWQVAFQPDAVVYAESPSTLRALWRQRVRWARGLLQGLRIHRAAVGSGRYGWFGYFLAYQVFAAVAVPALQIAGFAVTLVLLATGVLPGVVALQFLAATVVIGLVIVLYGTLLDDAREHLRYLWTVPLWFVYSLGMSVAMVRAIGLESLGRPNTWHKPERTGVISPEAYARMAAASPAVVVDRVR